METRTKPELDQAYLIECAKLGERLLQAIQLIAPHVAAIEQLQAHANLLSKEAQKVPVEGSEALKTDSGDQHES